MLKPISTESPEPLDGDENNSRPSAKIRPHSYVDLAVHFTRPLVKVSDKGCTCAFNNK